jgi:hypothetical protein
MDWTAPNMDALSGWGEPRSLAVDKHNDSQTVPPPTVNSPGTAQWLRQQLPALLAAGNGLPRREHFADKVH